MTPERRVVEVRLPNDTIAFVRATDLDEGTADQAMWTSAFDFEHIAGTLEGIAESIRAAVDKAKPSSTRVELGVELAVTSGKLVGLIVEGGGRGALTVTLEWHRTD
jgi:NTP-dependent ternary system trypsin peptidase co-occuring protein